MAKGINFGRWAVAIGAGFIAFIAAAAFTWREDILRTWLDPKQPFQTYRPPPAPDYANPDAWALIPAKPTLWTPSDPPADVFFVSPTTFDGGRDWNGPIDDRGSNRFLSRAMLPNYAGPFQRIGRVFAPRYRQASLYAFMTNKEDAQESRRFAYNDVRQAFETFLARYNDGRPIILVGVEQGGGLSARLLSDEVAQDPSLARRIAAVYLIDTIVPANSYRPDAVLPACEKPGEAHCVIAWMQADSDADAEKLAKRALVWSGDGQLVDFKGRPPLCTNPILGRPSASVAPIHQHLGAANATGLEWGVHPAFMPHQVSAQCVGGFLRVSKPLSPSLKAAGGWTDRLKEPPFNLFYADEEADVKARVATLTHEAGYVEPSPPIGVSIAVTPSPIHRIR